MHVSGRLRVADGAVVAGQPSFGSSFGVGGRTQGALGRYPNPYSLTYNAESNQFAALFGRHINAEPENYDNYVFLRHYARKQEQLDYSQVVSFGGRDA